MAVLIFKQGNYTETGSLAYAEPIFFTDANTLIISGGVSTYTNTEVSPQITAGRVDYRVATIDSINTGSFLVSGDVSASNLLLDGNATVRGNITMGGSGLDFGDASDDNVVFKADISSSFIPNNDDSFDLGSDSQRWKTAYFSNLNLSGSLYVIGGPIDLHSDTYISASSGTFTHLDVGSYLDVDVTGNTTFDGQGTLSISSSGAFKIDSPTSISIGTNSDAPIDIDSTTLDIDSSGDITIDADNSKIAISAGTTASLDGEEGIHIGLEERAPVRIEGTSVNVNASQNVDIDADGGKLTLDGSTGIDIGVEADVPIDVDSSTLDIDASGAITISGSGVFDVNAAGALTLDSDTSISIGTDNDKPIDIDSSTLDIDASGAITIDGTSTLSIDVDGATNINTSVGGIEINSEAGSLTLDGHTGVDIDASNSGKVTIDGAQGIDIGVASDTPIDIDSTTFDLDASGNITLDSTTGINVGTATSGVPISIGHTTSETTINDNLTVTGNFTVNGTTTYVSSSNVTIGDRIIELNYLGASGNGGLYVGDADGTSTSGSLLWDSSNDYWIAGAKDTEHKILLQNGDSIISGSGTNNQITTFTGTHGVDSSANLTFDGSILRITGTQEITSHLSGSASGSFKNILVEKTITSDSGSFGRVVGSIGATNGVVSGSSQVNYSGLSGINNDIVSASTDSDRVNFTITDGNITADLIGGVISGSSQVVLGSIPGFNTYTGSVDTEQSAQDTRLNQLASETGSITSEQAAQDTRLDQLSTETGSITSEQAAQDTRLNQLSSATGSYLTSSGSVDFSDITSKPGYLVGKLVPGNNVTITSGSDTLTIEASAGGGGGGTISGSSQIDHDATTNFVAAEHFLQSDITTVGTVTTGNVQAILPSGTISGSSQLTSTFDSRYLNTNGDGVVSGSVLRTLNGTGVFSGSSQVNANSITNFDNEVDNYLVLVGAITHSNGPTGLFNAGGLLSGSLLPGTNVTINSSSDGYFISSSAAGGGANDATITLTAGTGLTGGGDFTTNQAGNESITFNFDSNSITGSFLRKLGDSVISGSGGINQALTGESLSLGDSSHALAADNADLVVQGGIGAANLHIGTTGVGSTFGEDVRISGSLFVGKGTDSTSKTTGTLIVSGGLGVLTTINAGGDVVAFASSDERLKDNIKPIENPLDIISKISGNTFDWNSEKQNIYNGKDYGVIAQEIQKVMPELVDTRDSGYLAVKYDKIVPLLIESIKELKREIEELKSK